MHVLGIREPSAPIRPDTAKLIGVQVFDGRGDIRDLESSLAELCKALQHHGGDNGRGRHALEPPEAAVGVTACKDFRQKRFFALLRMTDVEPAGHEPHIPGLGEGEDV